MSRPTNNYLVNNDESKSRKNINFIETLVEIGEPFNSTLLAQYPEYKNEISAYNEDKKECFLSILNKIGEDGCQVLTDRIVNYIDDISNIDTTIPSALVSQAESLGYPYKDKKTVTQLTRLSQCEPILQNLVWGLSTNARNSKTILNRLGILSDDRCNDEDIISCGTDELNSKISSDISAILSEKIFRKRYLYLDKKSREENFETFVTSNDAPALLNFSWMFYSLFSNEIIENKKCLTNFTSKVIDFGKYNRTIYAIICYSYLYSKLKTFVNENIDLSQIEDVNHLAKMYMPFLYDNSQFDPLQAAWSIIYDNYTLSDYNETNHEIINDFINIFCEKLNDISFNAVYDFVSKLADEKAEEALPEDKDEFKALKPENINFIYRLNAKSFSYQQLILNLVSNIKTLFGLNLKDYLDGITVESYMDYLKSLDSADKNNIYNHGFIYDGEEYLLSDHILWDQYITDVIEKLFEFGKKIRTLREDLRLMTFRNSYKGTTALIQFSVYEYLKECVGELAYQAQEQYNEQYGKNYKLSKDVFESILNVIDDKQNNKDVEKVAVFEYWDFTEYFNRYFIEDDDVLDIPSYDSGKRVDWNNPNYEKAIEDPQEWRKYGSMDDQEILDFYRDVLNLPKDIYLNRDENDCNIYKGDGQTSFADQQTNLRTFLRLVYNSGVFTKRTNDDYEAIYSSGEKYETTNDSPWVAYKNKEYISKQIHPYIWNFTTNFSKRLYKANAVTTAIQNAEYEIIAKHIHKDGNIVNQYRLSQNFVDSSGYVTRYENKEHVKKEKTLSYDGILYPEFGYDLTTKWDTYDKVSADWNTEISGVKQKWYTDQTITLSKYGEVKELHNIENLLNDADFKKSVYFSGGYRPTDDDISGVLGNYCIDKYETAYGTNPHGRHEILYKENGYPFMRPLYGPYGMLFVDNAKNADYERREDSEVISRINDKFPRIVMSKDGTHVLIRKTKNTIHSYTVDMFKNKNNEVEKALILNCVISCDDKIFESEYFNDSLIKTIDDDFYILVPKYNDETSCFTNYLFYINKYGKIGVSKQSFVNLPNSHEDNLIKSGLFLNNSNGRTNVIVNTYYINKKQELPINSEVSAVYSDQVSSVGNLNTKYKKWEVDNSSFDVFNQFVQLYSSEPYRYNDSMTILPLSYTDETKPSIDLTIDTIDSLAKRMTDISVDSYGFLFGFDNNGAPLLTNDKLPFIRTFNINSDAGFNPVYLGEDGKIILSSRKSQYERANDTGAAFELLGPEIDFELNPIIEPNIPDNIYDEIPDDNERPYKRIHELYTVNDEISSIATSFSKENGTYMYGYSSIIENTKNKKDAYRIKNVSFKDLTKREIDGIEEYVTHEGTFSAPSTDTDFKYDRIYMFLGVNNTLYSLIPRIPQTQLQDHEIQNTEFYKIKRALGGSGSYTINFKNTYIFYKIVFSSGQVKIYGNSRELINTRLYLVHVAGNIDNVINEEGEESDTESMPTPNFMLPESELKIVLNKDEQIFDQINYPEDMIDFHMRAPHVSVTQRYNDVRYATLRREIRDEHRLDAGEGDTNHENLDIPSTENASLVFSITEVDSDLMNRMLPDQIGDHDVQSVTTEALNDFLRYNEITNGKTFDVLDYEFKPWQIVDLNLKREEDPDGTDTGLDEEINSVEKQYIIQPSNEPISIRQDAANKYTISFWRISEDKTINARSAQIENVLPNHIKVTEDYRPIFGKEHESLNDLIRERKFIPQLMVQWEYENSDDRNSPINLRFNNAMTGDSPFINVNAGLEYKSLSTFVESIVLKPGESGYIDIVAPNHVQAGRTVFYNIPLIRALATNISDNKPKFMLSLLNNNTDKRVTLESNNYALVFMSASEPQVSNSDIVYASCYVAPMISSNQTTPPSVSNAISLSELAFNFDIANIINLKKYQDPKTGEDKEDLNSVLVEKAYAVTDQNKISTTAKSYISVGDNDAHQIRVSEPIGTVVDDEGNEIEKGFITVDMKLNLQHLSNLPLKNALLTAHGEVIAYDNAGTSLPIMRIFGCSLDRIGTKYVLGRKTSTSSDVLTVTQNSGRTTAIQINPSSLKPSSKG